MAHALEVVGRLMVEMGDAPVRVEALGDSIAVELPSLRAGYSILKGRLGGPGRGIAIRRIHEALTGAGLRLEVRVGPRTVARLGVGARAGLASRILGVGPMELKVDGLLASRRVPVGPKER